jgi:hypothetical protein
MHRNHLTEEKQQPTRLATQITLKRKLPSHRTEAAFHCSGSPSYCQDHFCQHEQVPVFGDGRLVRSHFMLFEHSFPVLTRGTAEMFISTVG